MNWDMRMTSDTELMCKFQDGEEAAYDELVNRYYQMVYHYFCHMSWDRVMAEDICQEVFLKLYRTREQYHPVTTFKAYLFTIARNQFIDNYRKAVKRRTFSLDALEGGEGGIYHEKTVEVDMGADIDSSERMKKIMNAVNQLPEILKDVFLLSEIEGLKYSEISEVLNIPVGTVKSRMFTAVRNLRGLLSGVVQNEMS